MKAGAVDFLTKPFAGKDLLDAIQRALDRDTRALDTEARVDEILQRVKRLTPRETEVFALVVTGMLNKQIAAAIGVGEGTVKVHRARVMAENARGLAGRARSAGRCRRRHRAEDLNQGPDQAGRPTSSRVTLEEPP